MHSEDLNFPCQELSNGGLGTVATFLVRWQILRSDVRVAQQPVEGQFVVHDSCHVRREWPDERGSRAIGGKLWTGLARPDERQGGARASIALSLVICRDVSTASVAVYLKWRIEMLPPVEEEMVASRRNQPPKERPVPKHTVGLHRGGRWHVLFFAANASRAKREEPQPRTSAQ